MKREKMKMLGKRIKLIRLSKGMSQQALANKCGNYSENSRSWISKIESGDRNPNIDDIFTIAEALGVEPSILFMETTPSSDFLNRMLSYMVMFADMQKPPEGNDPEASAENINEK